jgi:uncharacterized protein YfaS (alpha-2-macroglobulin family)
VHALRGYRSYTSRENESQESGYQRLDYNQVPGRTVCDRWFPIQAGVDEVRHHTLSWDDILGGKAHGVVFVETEGANKSRPNHRPVSGAQALVQVTDLGMVWKTSSTQVWVTVFSYTSGKPVPGATVKLMTDESETLAEARTDAQGAAVLAADRPAWLLASSGDDLHLLSLQGSYELQIPTYRFNLPNGWEYEVPNQCRTLFFSDRSVYRPGETVHLKAIARQWNGQAWEMPSKGPVALCLTDSRGQIVLRTNLNFSALGSLDRSVALPSSPLGQYEAHLFWPATNNTQVGSCSFIVQEFEPNAFEVRLTAPPVFGPEDAVKFQLTAGYYLGKPLTRSKVQWTLNLNPAAFSPEGFKGFQFGADTSVWNRRGEEPMDWKLSGEIALDGREKQEIAPVLPQFSNAPAALQGTLLVEVTDLNQQTISESCEFLQHRANAYLGLRPPHQVLTVGESLPVQVAAVKRDSTPVSSQVPVHARLVKVTWQIVAKQGAGQTLVYESEETHTVVMELDTQTLPLVREGTGWDFARSTSPAPALPLAEPGEYILEITGKDDAGRALKTECHFGVSGPGRLGWKYRNPVQIELVPDKDSYLPGETAALLVKTPFGGPALVTVERESVRRSLVGELNGNAPAVRVPIEEGDAPNIYVSVMMLRGIERSPKALKMPEMRIGYCQLNVAKPQARLVPVITVSRPVIEPRQEVQVEVEVRDGLNALAPDTEVTLYAVDDGILSLTAYETPDPLALFQRPRPLAVTTWFSMPALLPEDPADATFHNKGYLIGGGGEAERELRKNFLPCAFWHATLRTDAAGKVRASFPAPDSLTRYRVIAVAHNARQQFGSGTSHFEVRKPLMVAPSLPLFAHLGDVIQARAVVHNMSDADGEVEVSLRTDALASAENATTRVTVPAHGTAPITLAVTMRGIGPSAWAWQGRFRDANRPFQDAVKTTLSIEDPRPQLREILARRVSTQETNLLAGANPRLLEGQGRVTVRLANTRLAEVGEAAGYLLHYPYGCVEQTCSSLLPWLALNRHSVGQAILARSKLDRAHALTTGLNRLLSMQTSGGGLAYWPNSPEPMRWASGYGGVTLALLQRDGAEVPEDSVKKLVAYLSNELRGAGDDRGRSDYSDHCLSLLALSMLGHPEPAYHARLFEKRALLSTEDRALLALAILEAHGDKTMARELLEGKGAAAEPDWFFCPSRLISLQLMAWCRCQPDHPKVEELVEILLGGQENGHWVTTQGNSWGLLALTDYARLVEGKCEAARGEIRFGGQTQVFSLPAEAGISEWSFDLAQGAMLMTNPDGRRFFARAMVESRPPVAPTAPEDHGFSLRREFFLLDDDGQCHELTQPQPGDRVLVRLRLTVPKAAHYVAVDSPLPALFEPIRAEFVTQKTSTVQGVADWWHDYRETRKDRVLFFRNHLPSGTYNIEHLARVRATGTATAPSAKVEEMYQPAHMGLTGAKLVGQ